MSEICKVRKIYPNQYPTSRKFCQDLLYKEFFLITIITQGRKFLISLVPLNKTNGHAYQRLRYLSFLGIYIIYQVPTLKSRLPNLQRHVAENVTERSGQHPHVHFTIIKRGSKPAKLLKNLLSSSFQYGPTSYIMVIYLSMTVHCLLVYCFQYAHW